MILSLWSLQCVGRAAGDAGMVIYAHMRMTPDPSPEAERPCEGSSCVPLDPSSSSQTVCVHIRLSLCLLPTDTTFKFLQSTSGPCVYWVECLPTLMWRCVFVCMNKNVSECLCDVCLCTERGFTLRCDSVLLEHRISVTVDVLFKVCRCKSIRVNDCVTTRKSLINCLHPHSHESLCQLIIASPAFV